MSWVLPSVMVVFFFFNDTATTEIYTLSLHDALPISRQPLWCVGATAPARRAPRPRSEEHTSELQSRVDISYAVFCLKKNTPQQLCVDLAVINCSTLRRIFFTHY